MKERPIIMGAESVLAILEGRKTQTRRVIKPRYRDDEFGFNVCSCPATGEQWVEKADDEGGDFENGTRLVKCPYGQVGDRLYVKETWQEVLDGSCGEKNKILYESDYATYDSESLKPWKSPIFMPRSASRILLEITNIRVEQVNKISEEDAIAEGVVFDSGWEEQCGEGYCTGEGWMDYKSSDYGCNTAKDSYRTLWDSLNAKRGYPWESNPWVWVLTFKRVNV